MAKALDGITVAEFSSGLAAAYAAMLLAEQGARAIRVETPGSAPARGAPHFHVLNRSKRSILAEPGASQQTAIVRSLIESADIVVTGAPAPRLRQAGLDYDSIRRLNPAAIALYLPPLGSAGELAGLDGGDELAAALCGITGSQWARSGDPVATIMPVASYATAVLGAIAAVAAVIARGGSRRGQAVEVPVIAGGLALQTGTALRHQSMRALYPTDGPQNPLGPIPCYRLFETADGRYLFIACGNPTFWNRFALALDRPDLVADARFEHAPWGISSDDRAALSEILEPIIRTRPRDEWLQILRDHDVPCAPALTREEFFDAPQVRYLDMRRELKDPLLGPTFQMGIPVRLSATPGAIAGPATAPDIGDLDSLVRTLPRRSGNSLGNRADDFRPAAAAPLQGVVILDFSSYIAGSFCGMLLAQLGADVLKIESLQGDSFRSMEFAFMGWNQGKRSLALNLNNRQGCEVAARLAERADIVLENMRPGRMYRFGLDYQSLSATNPRLIYMSISGYGSGGPEYNAPGFDPLLQARSGMMAAQGGRHHPVYLTSSPCDYGAAMLATLGCVLALRSRAETGRGQFCETSLLQAAIAFQAGEFVFYDGRPELETGSPEYRGPRAIARVYRCCDDRWLSLAVDDAAGWEGLRELAGIDRSLSFEIARAQPSEGDLAIRLADFFAARDRADALRMLAETGARAVAVNRIADLFSDAQIAANHLLTDLPHPKWGPVTQTGLLMKFSATPSRLQRSAPMLGEHSEEILRELLGYDAKLIDELRRCGAVGP